MATYNISNATNPGNVSFGQFNKDWYNNQAGSSVYKDPNSLATDLGLYQSLLNTGRQNSLFNQYTQNQQPTNQAYNTMAGWLNGNNTPSWMNVSSPGAMPTTPTFQNPGAIGAMPTTPSLQNAGAISALPNTPQYASVPTENPNYTPYAMTGSSASALTSTPDWQDVQKQVTDAYGTLGRLNLNDFYKNAAANVSSDLAHRGFNMANTMEPSLLLGLQYQKGVDNARLGAEGLLQGLQAGQGVRQEAAGNALNLEGLRQNETTSANDIQTLLNQIATSRRAETNTNAQQMYGNQMNQRTYLDALEQQNRSEANANAQQMYGNEMGQRSYLDTLGQQNRSEYNTNAQNQYGNLLNQYTLANTMGQQNRAEESTNFYNILNSLLNQNSNVLNAANGLPTNPMSAVQNQQGGGGNTGLASWLPGIANLAATYYGSK